MGQHSLSDAQANLSDLIARAERGEEVVITRDGAPVVELKVVPTLQPTAKPMSLSDMAWLDARRMPLKPGASDSATLVRQMRDEGY